VEDIRSPAHGAVQVRRVKTEQSNEPLQPTSGPSADGMIRNDCARRSRLSGRPLGRQKRNAIQKMIEILELPDSRAREGQRLLRVGILLFLFALLVGLAVPRFAVPRLGLSTHLLGLMQGTVLLVAGFAVAAAQAHAGRVSCGIVPRRIWMRRGVDSQSVGCAVGCWQFDVADCRGSGSGKCRSGAGHRSGPRHGRGLADRNVDDHPVGLARIDN